MTKEDQITAMVTVGALLTAVLVVGYYINTFFAHEEVIACGLKAKHVEQMNVMAPSGQLMTPIEFQTEHGRNALGVSEHTRIVNVSDGPPKVAIEVSLAKGTTSPYRAFSDAGGIGFEWSPDGLTAANSVCLRYAVKLPKGFEAGGGGILPGVFGGPLLPLEELSDGKSGFAFHTLWSKDGELRFYPQIPKGEPTTRYLLHKDKFEIERGKWVWIDQEITLNTPGQNDGGLSYWINGKLRFQNNEIAWRSDSILGFSGVNGAVYYGIPKGTSHAPADTTITLSPFQLSWN